MFKKLIQMILEAETQQQINEACGAIDRAYQTEKITSKDNEQLYKMISQKSRMIERNGLILILNNRQTLICECIAAARDLKDEQKVDELHARWDELQKVIDWINQH